MMEANKLQMFIGLTHEPSRDAQFVFGQAPLYELQMVFAKNSNDPFEYTGPESLVGKTVGTLRGAASSDQMKEMQGITVDEVTLMKQNLEKLAMKRIDLVYYHQMGLLWEIKEGGFSKGIVIAKNPLESKSHYIMFTKSVPPSIIAAIDKAVLALNASGKIAKIVADYQ